MSTSITVSIIIPCFNDGQFLLEAIQSAEKCSAHRYEIVVVNDGSTDFTTLKILSDIEQRGHRVLHQANRGLARARNQGIFAGSGRYILALDADNRIRPNYLARGIEILDGNADIDVVYGDAEYFGDKTGRNRVPEFNLRRLLEWNYIDACAVFRKSAWERCGGYDENMPSQGFEDWDLWCRIALSGGNFYHVDEMLFDYRVRKDSMSARMATPERVAAIMHHIRAKQIEIRIEDYLKAHQSWDAFIEVFKNRPIKTLISFLIRAYFPNMDNRSQTKLRPR
jgi:glycosyltransferase involved in cell wall biosynthesis